MKKRILAKFSTHTRRAIARSQLIAISQAAPKVTNLHLLYAISFEKGSVGQNILRELGFEKNSLINFYEDFDTARTLPYADGLRETFKRAVKMARAFHYPYVGTEHFVQALLTAGDARVDAILKKSRQRREKQTLFDLGATDQGAAGTNKDGPRMSRMGQIPDFWQAMQIPAVPTRTNSRSANPLSRYAVNLNRENAKENAHPIIGREREIERVINILMRKNKNNPVLTGEPGVGKTAVAAGLAQRINRGEVPAVMADRVIYELDLGLLLSGTTFRGEFEQRMKEVIEFASRDEKIILFVDELHNLMGAGSAQGSLDAANMLKPALAKGDLQLIGATTFDEYRRYIEKDPALERRFHPINVAEATEKETRQILNGIRKNYEKYHGVTIDNKAITAAIELSKRYINDRFLPDKAIDLIDEAQAKTRAGAISFDMTKKIKRCLDQKKRMHKLKDKLVLNDEYKIASGLKKDERELEEILELITREQERREQMAYLRVTENDIKEVVSAQTGVPLKDMQIDIGREALNLRRRLARQVVGQSPAIEVIAKTIQRSMSGIHDPNRPLGSFIFLGPTGVGKTYLAKTLAETLFKNPASFIRIDMSEFSEKHNVSRLVGAPAGYVGYEDGGKLTDKIRRNPYSLILFDEIEKAHPEVFNIMLQILEDGVLTDAGGRPVNFRNTVIIMTSNIGGRDFTEEALGFAEAGANAEEPLNQGAKREAATKAIAKLRDILLPELFNRIDNVLAFNPLSTADLKKIAKKEIQKLAERLKKEGVELTVDNKVYELLARQSWDKREGARLLRKKVEELIQNQLAEILLSREGKKRLLVKVKTSGKEIKFDVTKN